MLNTYFQITRSGMPIMALLATLLVGHLFGIALWTTLVLSASNYFLFAASMIINDWHDVSEDRINKPYRAIPSGKISVRNAFYLACILFGVGIALSFVVEFRFGVFAIIFVFFSNLYTIKLKRIPLIGNITVGVWTAYPLWCWSLVKPTPNISYISILVACILFILGREVVKTAEDIVGDSRVGIATISTIKGGIFGNRLGVILMIVGLVFAWVPVYKDSISAFYTVVFLVISVVIFYFFSKVLSNSQDGLSSRIEKATVIIIFLAIIAFGFGVKSF